MNEYETKSIMNTSLKEVILSELGSHEGGHILKLVEDQIGEDLISMPANQFSKTFGEWNTNLPYNDYDVRPPDALADREIDEMLKSGIIRFAVEMKRSQMFSIFKNKRVIKVNSPDEKAKQITEAIIPNILPQMAYEFIWSSLVYGTSFMEKVWEYKTEYQLGLSKGKTNKLYQVPKQINLVPHKTVDRISRLPNGSYNGFVQNPNLLMWRSDPAQITHFRTEVSYPGEEIFVSAANSIVIPYNGFSRNLWGESFLKPLYPLWFWYSNVVLAMVKFSTLMGDPPKFGKAPMRKMMRIGESEYVPAIDWMLAITGNLSKTNVVVIPSDVDENGKPLFEIGYLDMPDRTQPFNTIVELITQHILRAALTADQSTTQTSSFGSNALGEVHQQATALHNEMTVTSWLSYINKFLIKDISVNNFGTNGPPIWLETQGLDQREREFMKNLMGVSGNFKSFEEFAYMIDWRSLSELSGLPTLTEKQSEELKKLLKEQALKNQEDQMDMAKKYQDRAVPNNDKGVPDATEEIKNQKELINKMAEHKITVLTEGEINES